LFVIIVQGEIYAYLTIQIYRMKMQGWIATLVYSSIVFDSSVLIVDDDAEFRSNLTEVLTGAGYLTDNAASANETIEKIGAMDIDIRLLNFLMPKMCGIEALLAMKRLQPKTKVIMITAFASVENAIGAIKEGASDYVSKLVKINALMTTIRRILKEAKFEEVVQ